MMGLHNGPGAPSAEHRFAITLAESVLVTIDGVEYQVEPINIRAERVLERRHNTLHIYVEYAAVPKL